MINTPNNDLFDSIFLQNLSRFMKDYEKQFLFFPYYRPVNDNHICISFHTHLPYINFKQLLFHIYDYYLVDLETKVLDFEYYVKGFNAVSEFIKMMLIEDNRKVYNDKSYYVYYFPYFTFSEEYYAKYDKSGNA